LEGQLWQVGADWQPAILGTESGDVLSADGKWALSVVGNDIWMIYLSGGQRFNLTGNSGRVHCCPRFWPASPDTIVFGSWASADDLGPSTGYLSLAKFDLSEYRVLDEKHLSNALAAPGPDGQTIAYDRGGSSWLYDLENGARLLDPVDYGLNGIVRIAGPSWSPDGRQLAWTVAVTDPEWRIAVAVFDLEAESAKLFHPYQNVGRGGWFLPPAWSPDGRWLAFVAEDADPEQYGVWVIDVESGEEVYIGRGIHPRWSPDGRWLLVNSADGPNEVSWLVEAGTWYSLQMYLPPDAQVVDWLPVS
jgi:Tol biopolymer transport system component